MIDIILIFIISVVSYNYILNNNNNNNILYIKKNNISFTINKDNTINDKIVLLSLIIENMYKLKDHLVNNIDMLKEYKEYIEFLDKNFTPLRTQIYETNPLTNYTSYSVNKGEELSICLKSKNTNELHNINILMYVVIHEMTHFACPEIGHGPLFQKIFKKFIEESEKIGIYKYEDYSINPIEYCGMTINSNIK
jgi:predicted metal-dependent hydrolase